MLNDARQLVYVCSRHPITLQCLVSYLKAGFQNKWVIKPVFNAPEAVQSGYSSAIVVLDIYSMPRWERSLRQWITMRTQPIVLLSARTVSKKEHFRFLDLGVCGIVIISSNLANHLVAAVKAVGQSRLWIDRPILEEYVKQREVMNARVPNSKEELTDREHQVLQLLMKEYTNRQMASLLDISERTVKFHVHNILQKTNTARRQALVQATSSSPSALLQ